MPRLSSPMRKLPTQERSRQRVEKIIATAQNYMAVEGIDSLTCSKVAELSGLPNATLYQFFPNKESIFEVIAERWLAANMETLTKNDPSDGKFGHWQAWIEASVTNDYRTYKSQKALLPLISVMNANSHLREIEQRHDAVIKAHMTKGIAYFFHHLDDETLSILAEITMSVSHTLLLKAAGAEEEQSNGYLNSLKYMLNSLYLKYSY